MNFRNPPPKRIAEIKDFKCSMGKWQPVKTFQPLSEENLIKI
jgi:hypothetical protein